MDGEKKKNGNNLNPFTIGLSNLIRNCFSGTVVNAQPQPKCKLNGFCGIRLKFLVYDCNMDKTMMMMVVMKQMSKNIVFAPIMLHVRVSPYSLRCDKRQSLHWQQATPWSQIAEDEMQSHKCKIWYVEDATCAIKHAVTKDKLSTDNCSENMHQIGCQICEFIKKVSLKNIL